MNVNEMILNYEFDQRSIMGICAIIAAILCFTFFYAIWQWHSDWVLAHQSIAKNKTLTNTNQTAEMIAAIPNEHLFGKAFAKIGEVPVTNLQLRVTGIVKAEYNNEQHGDGSKAYISISGQPSKIYQVGDELPYGVKVYAITPEAVILENEGRLEKLPLPREKLEFKPRNLEEHP